MTDRQLVFFRALCAPFGAADIEQFTRGGRTLSYVKSRRLMNRLDDVCGVDGWYPTYRPGDRGYTCALSVLVPDRADGWTWLTKEDGGGFESMEKSKGVADSDNDEKSAYTNAFRRACVVWGLARHLYREGVPEYLGNAPTTPDQPRRESRPPDRPEAAGPAQDRDPGRGGYDNFRVPRTGKAAFAWAKFLEGHFQYAVVKRLNAILRERGFDGRMVDLDPDQVDSLCWTMIDEIKGWDNYNGEFDHLKETAPAHP